MLQAPAFGGGCVIPIIVSYFAVLISVLFFLSWLIATFFDKFFWKTKFACLVYHFLFHKVIFILHIQYSSKMALFSVYFQSCQISLTKMPKKFIKKVTKAIFLRKDDIWKRWTFICSLGTENTFHIKRNKLDFLKTNSLRKALTKGLFFSKLVSFCKIGRIFLSLKYFQMNKLPILRSFLCTWFSAHNIIFDFEPKLLSSLKFVVLLKNTKDTNGSNGPPLCDKNFAYRIIKSIVL